MMNYYGEVVEVQSLKIDKDSVNKNGSKLGDGFVPFLEGMLRGLDLEADSCDFVVDNSDVDYENVGLLTEELKKGFSHGWLVGLFVILILAVVGIVAYYLIRKRCC